MSTSAISSTIPPEKILVVDDEPRILRALQLTLGQHYEVLVADSGAAALELVAGDESIAVVLSDMNMPQMNGIELLSRLRELAPETVRIMLTANSDQGVARDAVNEGRVFRFLSKPWCSDELRQALDDGIALHRVRCVEKDLLDKTLRGAVRALSELLALSDSRGFGRSEEMVRGMRTLADQLGVPDHWHLEVAASLARIGIITLPREMKLKLDSDTSLSPEEAALLETLPEISSKLVHFIPRMELVAEIILHQDQHYDGTGFPAHGPQGDDIPQGARMLKALADLYDLVRSGASRKEAIETMKARSGWYDPTILDAIAGCLQGPGGLLSADLPADAETVNMLLNELHPGYLLGEDLLSAKGVLLLAADQVITGAILARITNYAKLHDVQEPVSVRLPLGEWISRS